MLRSLVHCVFCLCCILYVVPSSSQTRSPPREDARANSRSSEPNALARRLGLPSVDGNILLISDSNDRRYDAAFGNLFKLLRLGANPNLIDDPKHTLKYLTLISEQDRRRFYGVQTTVSPTGFRSQSLNWHGEDQFEREDSRKAFVARHRAELSALVPRLPLQLAFEKVIRVGPYDEASGAFRLSSPNLSRDGPISLWSPQVGTIGALAGTFGHDTGSVHVAAPMQIQERLRVRPEEARQLLSRLRRGNQKVPTLRFVVKFQVDAVRLDGDFDAVLDTSLLDYKIFAGDDELKLDNTPASNLNSKPFSTTNNEAWVWLEIESARLYALRAASNLRDDRRFLEQTLVARRTIERTFLGSRGEQPYRSSWRPTLPNGLLHERAAFSPDDLRRYSEWAGERAKTLPTRVRVGGINFQSSRIELTSAFGPPGFGRGTQDTEAVRALVQSKIPSSVGLLRGPDNSDLPVAIAMLPDPRWFGETLDILKGQPFTTTAFADFEVKHSEVAFELGQPILIMGLAPIAVGLEIGSRLVTPVALTPPVQPSTNKYDILGVKLGDGVDAAVAKLKTEFKDYQVADVEREFGDPGMPRFAQIDVGTNGRLEERFILGFRQDNRTLLYIKRAAVAAQGRVDQNAMRELIFKKYGNPDHSTATGSFVWSSNPTTKARLKRSNECHSMLGSPFDQNSIATNFITAACGEMLQATYYDGAGFGYILFDSTMIMDLRRAAVPVRPAPPVIEGTRSRL